ncbi:MAG: hypothetical protein V1904_02310 [Bacteroidota bacterium]
METTQLVSQATMLESINRSEIDIQIATAKQYPRNLPAVLNSISTLATMDTDTAEDCFYCLRRAGGEGEQKIIEGLSVRFAEIIASSWGNLRIQTRIIGNDGRVLTAQGVCHDLETNVAVSVEVKRRITYKNGNSFSDDMQVVTGNAASAIAFRNAVLKVVPKAITKKIVEQVKEVSMGKALDMETSRQNAIETFKKRGVSEAELLLHIGKKSIVEIDKDDIFYIRGLLNAIKEGTTTIDETFRPKNQNINKSAELSEIEICLAGINSAKTQIELETILKPFEHLKNSPVIVEAIKKKVGAFAEKQPVPAENTVSENKILDTLTEIGDCNDRELYNQMVAKYGTSGDKQIKEALRYAKNRVDTKVKPNGKSLI